MLRATTRLCQQIPTVRSLTGPSWDGPGRRKATGGRGRGKPPNRCKNTKNQKQNFYFRHYQL